MSNTYVKKIIVNINNIRAFKCKSWQCLLGEGVLFNDTYSLL